MAKVRFLFRSHLQDATLTATSGTPANLQSGGPARTWQSADLAEQEITAPFGASKNVNLVHLENLNFATALVVQFSDDDFATVKHAEQFSKWVKDLTYAAATHWLTGVSGGEKMLDANGDAVLDGGGDAVLDKAYSAALPIAAESMRLVVADSANPDGYVEIGRLVAGEYYEASLSKNISERKTFDYRERAPILETRGGSWRSADHPPQRVVGVEYHVLDEADATEISDSSLVEYLRTIGHRKDVLISVYPDEETDRERLHTVLGRITNRSGIEGDFQAVESGTPTLYSRLTIEVTESL